MSMQATREDSGPAAEPARANIPAVYGRLGAPALREALRGRPTTGIGPAMGLRLYPEIRDALDLYIAQRPDPKPSRPEMIRRILEDRLVHEGLIEPAQGVGTSS